MRQAGTISTRQDAERFANYLLSLGITSKVDGADNEWAIWIHDENQIPRSREELEQFRHAPHDPRYQEAEHAAKLARREAAEKLRRARRNYVDMRNEWSSPWRRRPVTLAMIGLSVGLALFGQQAEAELKFSWPDIVAGEVWRLVTPIFLHASISSMPWHLIFNMWMLYDLGTLIERRHRSFRFALLVLAIALASNYAQFRMEGPNFVGMSGVVYGLFGYAWVRGRLDPTCGLYLRPNVAFVMMAWLVLCIVATEMHVANWAHGAGLAVGAAIGYAIARLERRRRQNP